MFQVSTLKQLDERNESWHVLVYFQSTLCCTFVSVQENVCGSHPLSKTQCLLQVRLTRTRCATIVPMAPSPTRPLLTGAAWSTEAATLRGCSWCWRAPRGTTACARAADRTSLEVTSAHKVHAGKVLLVATCVVYLLICVSQSLNHQHLFSKAAHWILNQFPNLTEATDWYYSLGAKSAGCRLKSEVSFSVLFLTSGGRYNVDTHAGSCD